MADRQMDIIESIHNITGNFLAISYPEAPDPDMLMNKIDELVKEYWRLNE